MDKIEIIKKYSGLFDMMKSGRAVHISVQEKEEMSEAFIQIYKYKPDLYCNACVQDMINLLSNWRNANLNLFTNEGQEDRALETSTELEGLTPESKGLEDKPSSKSARKNQRNK